MTHVTNGSDFPPIEARTIRCAVCGPVDTYDDDAWRAHCAHLPASGGFDAGEFDDEPGELDDDGD